MDTRKVRSASFLALIAAACLAGCERAPDQRSDGEGTIDRLTGEMGAAVDQARDVAQEQGNRFIQEAEQQLRRMRDTLADGRKREDLTQEARERFNAAAAELEDDIEDLEQELRRLRNRGAEGWREIGPRIREAMDDLAGSFGRFRQEHLQQPPAKPAEGGEAPPR